MPALRSTFGFERLDALEGRLCVPCNEACGNTLIRRYFATVSRLGDGMAWYMMLAMLPLAVGWTAVQPVIAMALTAIVGLGVYKLLKNVLVRERPFASHRGVKAVTAPLDRYSFPSGHTMHATAFTVQMSYYFPEFLWLVIPFAASVALSRVILGLHYPSDVLAGALVGWGLARASLAITAPMV